MDSHPSATSSKQMTPGRVHPSNRCEFCNKDLKSDLDVSLHLNSSGHIEKMDKFRSDIRASYREIPQERRLKLSNFNEVLNLLRLRTPRDVTKLSNKGFFKINNEFSAVFAVNLAAVLIKSVGQYECFQCEETREQISKLTSGELEQFDEMTGPEQSENEEEAETESENGEEENVAERVKEEPRQELEVAQQVPEQPPPPKSGKTTQPPKPVSCNNGSGQSPSGGYTPNPESRYIPLLAKIKVEPKDK